MRKLKIETIQAYSIFWKGFLIWVTSEKPPDKSRPVKS